MTLTGARSIASKHVGGGAGHGGIGPSIDRENLTKIFMSPSTDLCIRPYALDDASALYEAAMECRSNGEAWMPWVHEKYSIEDSRAWLTRQVSAFERGEAFEFAIQTPKGRYLGGSGLNRIDKTNKLANLGYWVRSSARGKGVATAAARLVRDWGFRNTDLIRLEIVIPVKHSGSLRVAEKSGATREGILRSRLMVDGILHDTAIFSFVRADR